jgi:hypothetical protein
MTLRAVILRLRVALRLRMSSTPSRGWARVAAAGETATRRASHVRRRMPAARKSASHVWRWVGSTLEVRRRTTTIHIRRRMPAAGKAATRIRRGMTARPGMIGAAGAAT